jgi:HlyD family secretion protein
VYEVATVKKLLILLILIAAAAGGAYWYNRAHSGPNGEVSYTLMSVEYGSLTETVSATGILQPHEVVAVGSELSGRVVEIYPAAEVNKVVEEGTPLLKLDDRKAQLDLERAKIAVQLAQANVQAAQASQSAAELRVKRLSELDVSMQKDLDEARMQLKAAQATVAAAQVKVEEAQNAQKLAQLGVDLTVVRARSEPSAAGRDSSPKRQFTILQRKVVLGQLIAPPASAQLFTLASDLGQMQVHAQVSENDIGKIRASARAPQQATFTLYAYSDTNVKFPGHVAEVRPMPTNVHGAVFYDTLIDAINELDPSTKEWKLRPGMTASVDIILRRHDHVWKVPAAAFSFQLDEHYQTEAAREKLAQWQRQEHADDWKPVWILDAQAKPWPIFVRIGGKTATGDTGISDGQFNEVLEWDPDLNPSPKPGVNSAYPRLITGAPPVNKGGIFDNATVKVF